MTFNDLTMHDKVGNYDILLVFCLLQECSFNKLTSDTSLKVPSHGNMRSGVAISVIGGISSLMEMNAVGQ